jgi:hypothetical protein
LDVGQKAYDCASYPETALNTCLFSVENGNLTLSVGTFYQGGKPVMSKPFLIGDFNPDSYQKYPSSFRPDGIGIEADNALSYTTGYWLDELASFSQAHYHFTGSNGAIIKIISVGKLMGAPDPNAYYLKPKLFVFND